MDSLQAIMSKYMQCPAVSLAKEDHIRTDDWKVALHIPQSLGDRSNQIDCANTRRASEELLVRAFRGKVLPISKCHSVAGARDSGTPARISVSRSQGSKQLSGLVNE